MRDTRGLNPSAVIKWMREVFDVYPERGAIIWRHPPKNHPRMKGEAAGSPRPSQSGKRYFHIKMCRRQIKRGWLIFLWVNGRWPAECLDHINGNSEDDRIQNLREATVAQNAQNHKGRTKRTSLPMGVRELNARFQARITLNKKVFHLGSFATPEEAQRVYLDKRKELFGEYA